MRPPLALADFFSVAVGEYEHLNFTAASASTATLFIWAACLGIVLASLYHFYQCSVPGGVVRALLRAEALSPERAKTAEELGLASKAFALFELTSGITLRHVVHRVTPAEGDTESEEKYYIPEEEKYRAELRFSKEGNGVKGLVLTTVFCVVLAIVLVKVLPFFLGIADSVSG